MILVFFWVKQNISNIIHFLKITSNKKLLFCTIHSFIRFFMLSYVFDMMAGEIALISAVMFFFRSITLFGLLSYTLDLRYPHKKKSNGVRSGNRGGYETSPHLDTNLPENCSIDNAMLSFDVWHVAPSCWNQAEWIKFFLFNFGIK